MPRTVRTAGLLLLVVLGLPACGAVSFGFCTGWFCWDWSPYPPPCYPYFCFSSAAVAVADFDGDGHDDVVTGGPGTGTLVLLRGNGKGGLAPAEGFVGTREQGVDHLAVGRFDGDEHVDVAILDATRDEVRLLYGDGAGGLRAGGVRALGSAGGAVALRAADIDGLGADDLLVIDASGRITRLLAPADGGLAAAVPATVDFGSGLTASHLADVDGDGAADLVVADELAGTVEVWLADADGTYEAPLWSGPAGDRPIAIVSARLNDDPYADLAILDGLDGSLRIYLGRGDGTFAASTQGRLRGQGPGLALAALPGARGAKATQDLVLLRAAADGGGAEALGLESQADGTLRPTGSPAPLPRGRLVVPANLSEDGIPDLVFPGGRRSAVGVALGGARQP